VNKISSFKLIISLQKFLDQNKSQWVSFKITLLICFEASACQLRSCQWRDRKLSDLIKKIFICVLKMNKSIAGLEQIEGE